MQEPSYTDSVSDNTFNNTFSAQSNTATQQSNTISMPVYAVALRIGILTISDRASAGIYPDQSGTEIHTIMQEYITSPIQFFYHIIPDEQKLIEQTLIMLADTQCCTLIVTTGGTGPAPRDSTPEATTAVCTKMLPGFGEQMRSASLQTVPTAILSRQTAGIRGSTLILNLPGKPRAIRECLSAVFPAIPYCLELIAPPSSLSHVMYSSIAHVWRPS
jgi:molybdopterin adenylyltransferase